ncbi:MAG TPA: RNA polymerase sigma factor FliA [Burkholderiaceae bacterium]|nr:RNA polymerase sigma factor FliA [Burkholderiaceae bacterium]
MNTTLSRPAHDPAAIEAAVERYLPRVRRLAQKLHARVPASVELDDLVQAGLIGLAEAAARSQTCEGPQFEAFATQRVRGAMIDELRAGDWASRDVRRQQREATQAIHRLEHRLGRSPRDSEVAAELGVELDDYRALETEVYFGQTTSFTDLEGEDDEGDTVLDRCPGDEGADPLRQLSEQRRREALVEAIGDLPERERSALALYYEHGLSLKEVGVILGVTDSRVSHLHAQAFRRLRLKLQGW